MKRITVISQAALSRLLKCSRSTVSGLVAKGMPTCEDGKLDRAGALQWILNSTSGGGGGWDADHGRVSLRERAQAILAGTPVRPARISSTPPKAAVPAKNDPQEVVGQALYLGAVDALRRIVAPAEVLRFARVALRAGCSSQHAYILATWFSLQPTMAIAEVKSDDIENFQDLTNEEWCQLLGESFDFMAADALHDQATWQETGPAAKPEASALHASAK